MVSMCTMASTTQLSHPLLHSASTSPTTSSPPCIRLHHSRRQRELCSLASASPHRSLKNSLSFQRPARLGRSVAVGCSGAAEEIQTEKSIAAYNCRTNVLSSEGGVLQRLAGIFIGSALLVASLGLGYARPVLARPSPVETSSTVSEEEPSLEEEEKRVLESTPSDAVEEVKEKDPAELVLLSYLERHPEDVKALEGLMYIRLRKGSIAKALETVDTLLALRPDHAPWQLIRAQALEFLGDLDAARHAFEFILETDPLSARALQGLATVMSKAGEGTEAIEMLQRAIQTAVEAGKTKETKNLRMLLGQMYTLQGYLQEALAEYQELEKEDSRDFRPYLCQGLVYSLLDQKEDADRAFMKYRRRRPQTFGERGYLDDLMIGAKTEARKIGLEERQKQKEKIKAGKKKKSSKPMKQPDIETAVDPAMAEQQE